MRGWSFTAALLAAACDRVGHRPGAPQVGPGIVTSAGEESSAGDAPRLDLGTVPELDLPAEGTSTGSTSDASTSGTTGAPAGSTATGEPDGSSTSSGSTSAGDTSTGGPAAVCGDGICDPAERAPCWDWDGGWGPGFCAEDCMADPACVAVLDCPCTPEAAAVKSWCFADPMPACEATAPGGACSVSDALAFYEWLAKCG